MYTTLCSFLLASSSLTAGQSFFSGGCGSNNNCVDEGYGKYGTYGGYGSYGSRNGSSCGMGGGMGMGPFGAQNIYPGQSFPYAEGPPPQDKRVAEILKIYEEKLRDLEKKLLESEAPGRIADGQMKHIFDTIDKKLAASNPQPVSKDSDMLEKLSKQLADLERNLGDKLEKSLTEKLAAARKDDATLQENMAVFAKTLADSSVSSNAPLAKALTEIEKAIRENKSTAPNLHAWTLPDNRGLIVVRLPAEAKLYVNGLESPPGKDFRSFISPTLEKGKRYFYTLRLEVERNGKAYSDSREIYFEPGREIHVDFNQAVAANGAAVPAVTNKQE